MTDIEQELANETKLLSRKKNGPQIPAPPPPPVALVPAPTIDEIEAGLLQWRRTAAENAELKHQLAKIKSETDEMRGVLRSLASILVSYQASLTEQGPVQS
jgi:hypothetical protein